METKYSFEISNDLLNKDFARLINQMWKLLPMREKNENWEEQLDVVIEEISGLYFILCDNLDLLVLLSKLEGLRADVCKDFMLYRKTVFRCIDLIGKVVPRNGK